MSKSRMLLLAATAAFAVMLLGGAGPAAAQTSPTKLTKTMKLTGKTAGGKKFNGTYTIQRFTRSGSTLFAVGTVKGRLKGHTVTKKNVRIPVKLQRHGATSSQLPNPTPGACQILDLVLQPIDLGLLGLHVATSRIEALIEAVPGANALLGNLLCAVTGLLDPQGQSAGTLSSVLN